MNSTSIEARWRLLIVLICAILFLARLIGPSDLESNAQVLNVGYISDLIWGGHWLVQYDLERYIMSKPPLHTWMMAPFALLLGVNRLALSLPSILCVTALGLIVFQMARRFFDPHTAGWAAVACILVAPSAKFVTLARADPPFVLAVTAAAFAAFWAWERGRGWAWFWVFCAIGTLAKGPLAIVLAAGGLLAFRWEQRSSCEPMPIRGSHRLGIALFFVLCGSWFFAALLSEGYALIDKMFFKELIGHSLGGEGKGRAWGHIVRPTAFLLTRYLPFSIFAIMGIYRALVSPAVAPTERRLERFLICWIVVGLVIFTLAKHQRADLVWPMWPPAAILAGREIVLRFSHWSKKTNFLAATTLILMMTTLLAGNALIPESHGEYAREEKLAREVKLGAEALLEQGINVQSLYHVQSPLTLQMHLRTFRQWTEPSDMQQIISTAHTAVDVAFGAKGPLDLGIIAHTDEAQLLFRWPKDVTAIPIIQIYRFSPPQQRKKDSLQP